MMTLPLTKFGPIKDVRVPDAWNGPLKSSLRDMRVWTWFLNENVPGASINFFYRGLPVDSATAAQIKRLIVKTQPREIRELTDEEKKELREILGPSNAGSNQYTDDNNECAPVFHVDSVKMGWIDKQQPALFVRGRFNYAEPDCDKNEFAGVFLPFGKDRSEIYEIFLQAPGPAAFELCDADFEATLQSIVVH